MSDLKRETLCDHPNPPASPVEALRHVVAVYRDMPDHRMMVEATSNIYGSGVRTGLTMGDLRALAQQGDPGRTIDETTDWEQELRAELARPGACHVTRNELAALLSELDRLRDRQRG